MNDGVSQCPSFSYWAEFYRLERDETRHPRNSALHRSDVYVSFPPMDTNFVVLEQSIFSCPPTLSSLYLHAVPRFIRPATALSCPDASCFSSLCPVSPLIHLFKLPQGLRLGFLFLINLRPNEKRCFNGEIKRNSY